MAYYKTAYTNIPFVCKWECVHCAKKNIGEGKLPVKGDTVSYYPGLLQSKDRENAATEKSLKGVDKRIDSTCYNFINTVNRNKFYHPALASVEPRCVACGKRQPWQTRDWKRGFLWAMLGVFGLSTLLSIFGEHLPFAFDIGDLDTSMIVSSVIMVLILLAFIAPAIQGAIVDFRMNLIKNDACSPQVSFIETSTVE